VSNGIDFVIGGKNNAKPAMASVEQSLSRLESRTDSLKSATQGLMAAMGPLLAVFAVVKTAMAAVGGIKAANDAYDESALAVQGLETALRLQGANVEAESARLQSFASDMQSLVGAEDDATLAMMKHASMMGVATEDLDDMAKAAIGLGEAMGTDAESGMEMMRRAQEGNFMAFQKMFPAMRSMTTDTEKLAFVTDLAAKGLLAKADASNTVAGMGERANNALGDLMESVGALLAPVRLLISAGLTTLYESLSTLLIPAVEYANEVLENIGPIMDYVKAKVIEGVNAIVGAFTFFEVILTNLDSVWEIVVAQSELWMLQLVGVIEHALTVAIPAYAAWFGENFVNLIRDGLMLAFTVVTNHVQKIIDAFKALWDFIASGGTTDVLGQLGEISGRSWLEGFESSLTDLPSIMGRTISDREKELGETIGRVGGELGDEFSRKFAERMIKAGGDIGGELSKDIDLKMNAAGDVKDGKSGGTQSINAMESRLLTRGPATDPGSILKRIEDILDKTHSTQKGIAKSCSTIVNYQMESVDELTKITTNTGDTVLAVAIP
jgi:hypothetical protein